MKAIEMNISKDEASKTLLEIIKATLSIKEKYLMTLDDFYADPIPLEADYNVHIHRLSSIAKEDPGLALEMGRMDVLVKMQPNLFQEYFDKKPSAIGQVKGYFPTILSLDENAIFEFLNAVKHMNKADEKLEPLSGIPRSQYHSSGIHGIIFKEINEDLFYFAEDRRRLFIALGNYREVEKRIRKETAYNNHGLFLIARAELKIENADEIKLVKGIYGVKSNSHDGILYRCKDKTFFPVQEKRFNSVHLNLSDDNISLFRQFIKPEKVATFVRDCIASGCVSDLKNILFNMYGQDEIPFKINDASFLYVKKGDKK